MKKIFFFIFMVFTEFMSAQNYQNICSQGTTFYRGPDNEFMAFRRDSMVPAGNNDTLFFSYRTIRDSATFGTSCADTTNGSILGLKISKQYNGLIYFFNKSGDSVKINSQASLNQSWKFCKLPGNGYIEATVLSIGQDSVLGIIDQVKTITFQAKDSAGNSIPNQLNQKSIKLSQHYGLLRMLDVYSIPNDTTMFILAGKSNPVLGIQNLTWKEIYDFNVGDVFHYMLSSVGTVTSIYKVLSKTSYGSDSVAYAMEHCSKFVGPSYPDNHDTIITAYDTIVLKYSFTQYQDDIWLSRLPKEFFVNNHSADTYSYSLTPNKIRRVKFQSTNYTNLNSYPFSDTCWRIETVEVSEQSFAEGLGRMHLYYYDFNDGEPQHMQEDLVYYKKGNEIWGTPVSTDCVSLTGIPIIETKKAVTVTISPNPVESHATILLNNVYQASQYRYIITDIFGRIIFQNNFESNPSIFKRLAPAGLYFVSVLDDKGNILTRTKVVFK